MRTTLDLPDETFRQLKVQAALNGLKLKELVTEFIERGLDGKISKAANAAPAERHPIPIAREADGSVTPYLSNAQLYVIMNDQDLAQHQRGLSEPSGPRSKQASGQ